MSAMNKAKIIAELENMVAARLFSGQPLFIGLWDEWDVPFILEEYGLLDESEFDAISECTSEANAERLLSGYVKRAYFDYRKAAKFLH